MLGIKELSVVALLLISCAYAQTGSKDADPWYYYIIDGTTRAIAEGGSGMIMYINQTQGASTLGPFNAVSQMDAMGVDITSVDFMSNSTAWLYLPDGTVTRSDSVIAQSLDWNKAYSIAASQRHNLGFDFKDPVNFQESGMVINNTPFGSIDVNKLVTDPSEVNEIMQHSSEGMGVDWDLIRGLIYDLTYDRSHTETKGGVSCTWGEAKNRMVELV